MTNNSINSDVDVKRARQPQYIFAVDDDDDIADTVTGRNIKMELEESNICNSAVSGTVGVNCRNNNNGANATNDHLEQEEHQLEESSQLDMMSSLGRVFEDTLMEELDSDLLHVTAKSASDETDTIDVDGLIMQHMDIREPLSKLRQLLEVRLHLDLSTYQFTLQDTQMLESHKTLVDQCVQGEGLVQVNLQLQHSLRRINIIDVLKPAEDYLDTDDTPTVGSSPAAIVSPSRESDNKQQHQPQMTDKVVQWQLDLPYKREQERLRIPSDPKQWNVVHVRHWVQWAVRQFNLPNIKLADWSVNGDRLYQLNIHDFQRMAPNDTNDIFWTHFELLRKMKMVATIKEGATSEPPRQNVHIKQRANLMREGQINRTVHSEVVQNEDQQQREQLLQMSRYMHNGPIQLWQFLLELLTSRDHRHLIAWESVNKATQERVVGGEFKLLQPEEVATLWGDRKNKPTMNYEKLSRALRYYYDGDMISKVAGKRFVYKFVCDLRQVLGYSAFELANLVTCANPNPNSTPSLNK